MTTRTVEPNTITQGERIEWTRAISSYSAEDYDLEYRFRSSVGPGADIAATAGTDSHGFSAVLTAEQSALMNPGRCVWQAWVTEIADPTNTLQVDAGTANVVLGFVSGSTGDIETRSVAQQWVDAYQSAMFEFAVSPVQEYEITTPAGSRRVKRGDMSQLREELQYWKKIVAREIAIARYKQGKGYGRTIQFNVRES